MLESNIYALYAAKQASKGAAAATPSQRFIQVAGDFTPNREDSSENYSDLDRFGNQSDWVNTLVGNGNPGIEATPDELSWLCWIFFGGEAVTGTGPFVHTFTPATSGGFWSTWWQRVGATQVRRDKFNDCKMGTLQLEGSTANKALRATPTLISLDPGEKYDTDPATAMPADARPFLFTEGKSAYTVDGVAITGTSQFTLIFEEALGPVYGDDQVPLDLVPGNASISIAATLQLDAPGLAQYNKIVYDTATPAAGAKPVRSLPATGSWSALLTKDANTSLSLAVPGVKWSPDLAIPPNPDGGAVELSLAGMMRKVTGQQAATVVVKHALGAHAA